MRLGEGVYRGAGSSTYDARVEMRRAGRNRDGAAVAPDSRGVARPCKAGHVAAPQDRIEVTLPEVRELATEWARQLDTLAAEMYAFLAARIPEARVDDEIAGLTLASCSSNVEAVLSMIRYGIPAS